MSKQQMRRMFLIRKSKEQRLKFRLQKDKSLRHSSVQLSSVFRNQKYQVKSSTENRTNHIHERMFVGHHSSIKEAAFRRKATKVGVSENVSEKSKQAATSEMPNEFTKSLKVQKSQLKYEAKKQLKQDRFKKNYKVKYLAKKEKILSQKNLYLRRVQLDRVLKHNGSNQKILSYYRTKEQLAAYKLKLAAKRLRTAKLRDPIHPVNIAVFQAKSKALDAISQDDTLRESVNTYYQVQRTRRQADMIYRIGNQSFKLTKNLTSHAYGLGNRTFNLARGKGFERTPKTIQKTGKLESKKQLTKYQQFINRYKQAKKARQSQKTASLIKETFTGKKQLIDGMLTMVTQPAFWLLFLETIILLFFFGLFLSSSRPVIVQDEKALTDSWTYVTHLDASHTDESNQFFSNIDDIMFYMNVRFEDYELSESRAPLQTYRQYLDVLWEDLNGKSPDYTLHTMADLMKDKKYALSEDEKELYALIEELRYTTLDDNLEFPYTTDQLTIGRRYGYEKKDGKEELYRGIEVYTSLHQPLRAPINGTVFLKDNQIQIVKEKQYRLTIKGVSVSGLTTQKEIKVGQQIGQSKGENIQIFYEKFDSQEKNWFYVNPAFYFPKVIYTQQTFLKNDSTIPNDMASRAKYIYNYFTKLGFTREGIAAILGNWQVEASLNPKRAEGDYLNPPVGATATSWDDENWLNMSGMDIYGNNTMIIHRGLGLGQFTDTRDGSNRNTLVRMYAKEKNKKWYDMDLQLDFIVNGDVPAYRTYLNRTGKSLVSKDVAELTNYFLTYWEGNPGNKVAERINAAKNWYAYFANPINQSSYRLPLTVINLSSPFGWRNFGGVSEFHRGLDFAAAMGTPIYAIADGQVIKAEYHYSWGNYVQIKHLDGRSSLYAHQSQLLVRVGQEVHQGDKIGLVGSTGNSTGAHLHLEISKSTNLAQSELLDPAIVLGLK